MSEYEGLPLDTPTKIQTVGDIEVWATRTKNGGTVERRLVGDLAVIAGNEELLRSKASAAITANRAYLDLPAYPAAPTAAQRDAAIRALRQQTDALTRQCNALTRIYLNLLSDVADT